jgi:aldehyde:ferredoxin oxidoreductase
MLNEYYDYRDWGEDGIPSKDLLASLGLLDDLGQE